MANPTSVFYTGDGTTTDRNFPFPYLSPSHVKVTVDGVAASFIFIAQNTVRISPAPAAGKTIRIYRETAKTPLITWEDGVVILGRDMNAANVQNIYIAEEAFNEANAVAEQAKQFALDSIGGAVEDALRQSEARLAAVVTDPAAQAIAAAAQAAEDLIAVSTIFDQVNADKGQVEDVVAQANDSLTNFYRIYLGEKSAEPTTDNEGGALIVGALFFDTTDNKLKIYTPSCWKLAYNAVEGLPDIAASNVDNDSNVTGANVKLALDALKSATDALASAVTAKADVSTTDALASAVALKADVSALASKQDKLAYTPVNKAGDTITGDLTLRRSAAPVSGALWLGDGSGGQRYLYYDGTVYVLNGAELLVNGSQVWNDGLAAVKLGAMPVGGVGTYAFAIGPQNNALVAGQTFAGGALVYASADGGYTTGGLPGTWRCMGRTAYATGPLPRTTLWQRIS